MRPPPQITRNDTLLPYTPLFRDEIPRLLAAEVGNTNVVFALFEAMEIRARWRIATDPRRTADEYAVWLLQLLEIEGYARSDVTQLILGSVVPRALDNLTVLETGSPSGRDRVCQYE